MTLEEIKRVAVPACRESKVKRLDLFGSLARGEGTTASDVDLLVEFEEPDLHPSKRFFGLLHHLEDALICLQPVVSAIPIFAAESSKSE
jgi:predicted nucleotidyltransferase